LQLKDTANKVKSAKEMFMMEKQNLKNVYNKITDEPGLRQNFVTSDFSNEIQVLFLHPMEVARQMTLIEVELLENIEVVDFLYASKDSSKAGPVKGLTSRFNKTSSWIATEMILKPTPLERAQRIEFFISLGQSALVLKNFNLLMSVLAGLNYASVQRLKKSWKLVSPKLLQTLQALEALMSSAKNYQAYRAALKAATWPKLPYFGVFLRDLQFVDVGNQTWISSKRRREVDEL
jgi:son of sevenless-like protein